MEKSFLILPHGSQIVSQDADTALIASFEDFLMDAYRAHAGIGLKQLIDFFPDLVELG